MSEETTTPQAPLTIDELVRPVNEEYLAEIRQRITRTTVEAALREGGYKRCAFQLLFKLPRGVSMGTLSDDNDTTASLYLYSLVDKTQWSWYTGYVPETRCIYHVLSIKKPAPLSESPVVEKPVGKPVPVKEPGCVLV